jgi:hypothetical protein
MKEENKDSKSPQTGQRTTSAGGGAAGFRLTGFPKEFERNILEDLDKRYMLIMLGSWIFVYGFAIILGSVDYDQEALAAKARQNYLDKFYQAQIVSEPVVQEEENGTGGGQEEEAEEEDARAERDRGRTADGQWNSKLPGPVCWGC